MTVYAAMYEKLHGVKSKRLQMRLVELGLIMLVRGGRVQSDFYSRTQPAINRRNVPVAHRPICDWHRVNEAKNNNQKNLVN